MPSPSSGETNVWLAAGGGETLRLAVAGPPPVPAAGRLARAPRGQRFGLVPRIGLSIFGLLLLASLLAPVLPLADPLQQTLSLRNAGPSAHHLLGTDLVGRDMLSRIIYGCRSAFAGVALGLAAMLALGVPWGLAAGFSGGAADELLMRVADALLSFPPLVLAIGVVSALGPSLSHAMVTVGLISAPGVARLLRSAVLPVRGAQFVLIAQSLGVGRLRIAARHVLPNAMAPVVVQAVAAGSYFLIVEAALSFLGLGVPPPSPSWGADMASAYLNFTANPAATVAPGLAITVGAWSISAVGDGLRDVLVRALPAGRLPAGRGGGGQAGVDDVDLPAQVPPVLLGGRHGHRHAVEGGGGDEEAEQVKRGRDGGWRDPALGEQVADLAGDRDGVWPVRNGGKRDPGQAAVPARGGDGLQEQPGQALAPVARGRAGAGDDRHDVVEHGAKEVVPVRDVHVERGRAGVEFLGDPAHAHRVEAVGVGHAQGGRHDGRPAERGPDGTAPAANRLTGTSVHGASLRRHFLTYTVR
jgi:peptide/nickel transport system permease protein